MDFEKPQYVNSKSAYNLLKEDCITTESSTSKSKQEAVIKESEVKEIPGYWMYRKYTPRRINLLRLFHLIGYTIECVGGVLGMIVKYTADERSADTPFTVSPFFVSAMWVFILILGIFFLLSIHTYTFHIISLLTEKVGWCHLPLYFLIAFYLISMNFNRQTLFLVFNILCLVSSGVIVLFLYKAVKYDDDGRYVVSRLEFLGVHSLYSVLTSWILIEMCDCILFAMHRLSESSDGKLYGWDYEKWTITIMSILFSIAVIMLYKFRDLVYAGNISYAFLGVYVYQVNLCVSHCSHKVQVSALAYCFILLSFVAIIGLFHPKSVCYLRRHHSDNN